MARNVILKLSALTANALATVVTKVMGSRVLASIFIIKTLHSRSLYLPKLAINAH